MRMIIIAYMVFSLITFNLGVSREAYSQSGDIGAEEKVAEKIEAEEVAKELAEEAGGTYVKGDTAPALKGSEVALPIVDEESGRILGYVVAEKEKLVVVLNEAGLSEVANALAAMEAGSAAAGTVTAGISAGTITWIAIGVAALAGIGFAIGGGGGGGGGGGSTSNH
ncbi:MAG: hypothetical protein C4581_13995 [Nitrospiraceae bacterium]|nr:MAG: hypothetical protein C4581_13995 [Nitrospiraceae bacterium]